MLDWYPTSREPEGTERFPHQHGAAFRWVVGAIVPLAIAAYGVWIVATQHTSIGGRRGSVTLTGLNATAVGVAWLGLALFVHCRYFWDEIHDSHWLSEVAKVIALAAAVGGMGVVLVRNGVFGIR